MSSPPRVTVERSCEDASPPSEQAEDVDVQDAGDDQQAAAAPAEAQEEAEEEGHPPRSPTRSSCQRSSGANLQEAQDALQARGSFLLTQTDGTGQERFQMLDYNWKVCAQDPSAGTVTSLATLVELVAVKLSESC